MNTTKFFYGGHSLGGSTVAKFVNDEAKDALGAFVFGSYVSISVKNLV